MNEIMARVAKAIDQASQPPGRPDYTVLMENCARAAIEAMRVPTEAMIRAAGGPVVNLERADNPSYEPQLVWEDMIDAALADTPREGK